MKKPAVFFKIAAIVLAITFITGQIPAGQISPTLFNSTLAPSSVFDPDINPSSTSDNIKYAAAGNINPGTIGNGAPLLELAQGKLPPRLTIPFPDELEELDRKIYESIDIAIRLMEANTSLKSQYHDRAKEALTNLVYLKNYLSKGLYLFTADVKGRENYLLGFNLLSQDKFVVGLSFELIDRLYSISPLRLAQYIFHECVPEKGMMNGGSDHRVVYNEIQSAVFGRNEVIALKENLREFIDEKVLEITDLQDGASIQNKAGEIRKETIIYVDDKGVAEVLPVITLSTRDLLKVKSSSLKSVTAEALKVMARNGQADISRIIRSARRICPGFDPHIPPSRWLSVTPEMFNILNFALRYQIYLPNNEIFEVVKASGRPNAIMGEIKKETWCEQDYLGSKIWVGEISPAKGSLLFSGLMAGWFAIINSGYFREIGKNRYRDLKRSKFVPGLNYGGRPYEAIMALRIENARIEEEDFIDVILECERYKEIRYAQDNLYAVRRLGRDNRFDPDASLQTVSKILKPYSTLSREVPIYFDRETVHGQVSARLNWYIDIGTIREYSRALGGIIAQMKKYIAAGRKESALMAFLSFMDEQLLCATSEHMSKDENLISYHDAAKLFLQDIDKWAGKRLNHVSMDFLNLLAGESQELPNAEALKMLEEIYSKHFWTDEERMARLPPEPFELPGPFAYPGTSDAANPGAIGNGAPLAELAWGKLPPELDRLSQDKRREVDLEIRKAIDIAKKSITDNSKNLPSQHRERVREALGNLSLLKGRLAEKLYLFTADVRGPEDYLLGFNILNEHACIVGLSLELINRLYEISPLRLAQYIFHECVPGEGPVTDRADHRIVYDEIASVIFGRDEVIALKEDFRGFIEEKVAQSGDKPQEAGSLKAPSPKSAGKFMPSVKVTVVPSHAEEDIERTILKQKLQAAASRFKRIIKSERFMQDLRAELEVLFTHLGNEFGIPNLSNKALKYVRRPREIFIFDTFIASGKIFRSPSRETIETAWQGVSEYVLGQTKPAKNPGTLSLVSALAQEPEVKTRTQAALIAQISEDLPVRAKEFSVNLTKISSMLAAHPEQYFFIGIEVNPDEPNKREIMPLYKAVDAIENMKDSNGKSLFPNLIVKRASAKKLMSTVKSLKRTKKINLNNVFIGARKISVDNEVYDEIKGEGRAWITAIDDSTEGKYLPIFEAITLNMMAYLSADDTAIKNFYDTISDRPVSIGELRAMIRSRTIYILPKAAKFEPEQLRKLYELVRQAYTSA